MFKSFFFMAIVGLLLGGCATVEPANSPVFQQNEIGIRMLDGKRIAEKLNGHVAESLVELKCPDFSAVEQEESKIYFKNILSRANKSEEWFQKMSMLVKDLSDNEINMRMDPNVSEYGAFAFEVFDANRVRKFVIFKGINEFACDISSRELAEMNAVIYGIKGSPLLKKAGKEKKVILNFN